jgi:sugar lactone lactonase YvrE
MKGRFFAVLAAVAAVVMTSSPGAAALTVPIRTVVSFDPGANEFTEGLAIDHRGTMYVGMALTGEIRGIAPEGSQFTLAKLDVGDGLLLGLATDARGTVYAALASFWPETHGVWRITPDGQASRLAALDPSGFPNALAFDERGNLFASDSFLGLIWRIPAGGGAADLWVQDPLLSGDPVTGIGIGANGLAFRGRFLYAANTDRSSVVRIPVNPDGTAGTPSLFVQDSQLHGADGIAWDVKGHLYVVTDGLANSLARVDPGLSVSTLADAGEGLDYPTSVAFGTGLGHRTELFIANGGFNFGNPAVLAADVGTPGAPLA